MTRRILLVSLLTVALAGFAKGQGASEQEEVAKKDVLEFQEKINHALDMRDREALAPLFADGFTFTSERFGRGEVFNKAQFLDLRTSPKKPELLIKRHHEGVTLHVFENTVVMNGYSKTIVRYKGRISEGPRLFTFVYVKRNGQWQAVTWQISDIPYGEPPWDAPLPSSVNVTPPGW
jgi:Domain of unknown function (DUF4440)